MQVARKAIERFLDMTVNTSYQNTNSENDVRITNNAINKQNSTQIEEVLNNQDLETTISQAVSKAIDTVVQTQQEINQANATAAEISASQKSTAKIVVKKTKGSKITLEQANRAKLALQQSASIQSVIKSDSSSDVKAVTADILGASAGQGAVVQTQQEFQALAKAIQTADHDVVQSAESSQESQQSKFRARIEPFVRRIVFKRHPSMIERFLDATVNTSYQTTNISNRTVQDSTEITDINQFQKALNRSDVKQLITETYASSLVQKTQNISSNVQSLQNTCSACAKVAMENEMDIEFEDVEDTEFAFKQENEVIAEMAQSFGMFLEQAQATMLGQTWDSSTSQYAEAGQSTSTDTSQGGSTENTSEQSSKQTSDQSTKASQTASQKGSSWVTILIIGIVVIIALSITASIIIKVMKSKKNEKNEKSEQTPEMEGFGMRGGSIMGDCVYY